MSDANVAFFDPGWPSHRSTNQIHSLQRARLRTPLLHRPGFIHRLQ